jgi:hypothetical protein
MFNAVDNAGNSMTKAYTIYVDDNAPSAVLLSDSFVDILGLRFIQPGKLIHVSSYDETIISCVEYSFDNVKWTESDTFAYPDRIESEILVYIRVSDILGNSATYEFIIFIDGVHPQIEIIYEGIYGRNGAITHLNSKGAIHLEYFDDGSGISEVWYSIDDGAFLLYGGLIDLPTPGKHTIVIRCLDNVGNLITTNETVVLGNSLVEDLLYSFGIIGLISNLGGGLMFLAICILMICLSWAWFMRKRRIV